MPRAEAARLVSEAQPQSSTPLLPAVRAAKAVSPAQEAPERIQGVSVIMLLAEFTPTLRALYVISSTGLPAAAAPAGPAGLNRIESTNLEFAPVLAAWRFQLEVTLLISSSEDTPSAAIAVLAGSTRPRPSVMRVRTM